MFGAFSLTSPEGVAHTIQVALTPVFLLSAIATLLNVFSTRHGRVADHVDALSNELQRAAPEELARLAAKLSYLKHRSLLLDAAVALAATGGAFDSAAALTLFLGTLRNSTTSSLLFAAFGLAIVCTTLALALYLAETLLAGRGLRAEAGAKQKRAQARIPPG